MEVELPKKGMSEDLWGAGGKGLHALPTRLADRLGRRYGHSVLGARRSEAQKLIELSGQDAQGVAEGFEMPTTWTVERSENIRWKTAIPGLAHSSPVIWGERLFVTTAVSERGAASLRVGHYGGIEWVSKDAAHSRLMYALNKSTGDIMCERTAHEGIPKVKRHTKSTHANGLR